MEKTLTRMERVETWGQYESLVKQGECPLMDLFYDIEITLRVAIQDELFGKKIPANDARFYRWVWANRKSHNCEETGLPIPHFSAGNHSHILSKGAHPEMRYDPRNINLVYAWVHTIWEFGSDRERRSLKIYKANEGVIEILRRDYNGLHIRSN